MERLRQRELVGLLACVRASYATRGLDAFRAHVVHEIPALVPCTISTYNEIDRQRRRITWLEAPATAVSDGQAIFARYMHEHPFIGYRQRTRDDRALTFSDFLDRHQLHRLGLYNEFYRPMRVEYQTSIPICIGPPLSITIALNRDRRDFSGRERTILELLRPHLIQAYGNARAVSAMQGELALLARGMDSLGLGVARRARAGRLQMATPLARYWLERYFDRSALRSDRLPEAIERWVRQCQEEPERVLVRPRAPLVIEREGRRLIVRLVSDDGGGLLILKEQQEQPDPTALKRLGLTRREAAVLGWVAQAKTNAEVGAILGMSPRTVAKHLEHTYAKLGVETRTAAAARAFKAGAEPLRSYETIWKDRPDLLQSRGSFHIG